VTPVRRAVPGDLTNLLPLVAEFCAIDGHEHDADRVRTALGPLLGDDALGQVWVLDGPAGPDGYAVVTWGWSLEGGGRDALLDELYVRHRDRGTGSRLLAVALEGARAAGATRIFLETEAPNDSVRRFYRRHGFVDEDSVWLQRPL